MYIYIYTHTHKHTHTYIYIYICCIHIHLIYYNSECLATSMSTLFSIGVLYFFDCEPFIEILAVRRRVKLSAVCHMH